MPSPNGQIRLFSTDDEHESVLFVLFIPSRDKQGKELPKGQTQELWAGQAGDLLTELFGGATFMPLTKGKWFNEEEKKIVTQDIQLIHSYARPSDAADEVKLGRLAAFLHRLGKEAKQGEVAVLIGDNFHRIRKFNLARKPV